MSINDLDNPFIVSKHIPDELFCDRKDETATLIKQITNGKDVVLVSPRRMGKTGLIHHLFRQPEISDNYYTFFVDIYAATSLREMCHSLGKTVFESLKSRKAKVRDAFFQTIKTLRAGFKIDSVTGEPTFELSIGAISEPETTLEEIVRFLEQADKRCIVAIDEFQAIMDYPEQNVEALLRTYIQDCNNAWFVFSGSKRHMMGEMFSSPARPFYQSASTMSLKPIPFESYASFITYHFEQGGLQLEPEAIRYIYDKFEGTTWYIQKICNELYAMASPGNPCGIKEVDIAINYAVEEKDDTYQDLLTRLSARQKALLIAMARSGKNVQPTSGEFIKKYHLASASAVQRSLSSLQEKDIITNHNGKYYIYDYFLYFWLARK